MYWAYLEENECINLILQLHSGRLKTLRSMLMEIEHWNFLSVKICLRIMSFIENFDNFHILSGDDNIIKIMLIKMQRLHEFSIEYD